MRYQSVILLTLALCIFVLASCGGRYHRNHNFPEAQPPDNNLNNAEMVSTINPAVTIADITIDKTVPKKPVQWATIQQRLATSFHNIAHALHGHKGEVYAILLLVLLWIISKAHRSALKYQLVKLNLFDMGMLKNIQDSASILWDKYRKPKNIYSLDDYRR